MSVSRRRFLEAATILQATTLYSPSALSCGAGPEKAEYDLVPLPAFDFLTDSFEDGIEIFLDQKYGEGKWKYSVAPISFRVPDIAESYRTIPVEIGTSDFSLAGRYRRLAIFAQRFVHVSKSASPCCPANRSTIFRVAEFELGKGVIPYLSTRIQMPSLDSAALKMVAVVTDEAGRVEVIKQHGQIKLMPCYFEIDGYLNGRPENVLGPSQNPPRANFTFELVTRDYNKARWTLAGPVEMEEKVYVGSGKIVVPESKDVIYKLLYNKFEILDSLTGQSSIATLPSNFPEFSWVTGLAYDTRRKVVTVVTLGGEGFLYRFNTKQRKWVDYRSLKNVDLFALTYDQKADRYIALTDQGDLVFMSGEGDTLFSRKKVISRLQGLGHRGYFGGNGPGLILAANGDDIALVRVTRTLVTHIWHYNVSSDNAVLTYLRG